MKYLYHSLVAVAALAMLFATAQDSTAALVDAGFESGAFVDDGSGVGKWQPFSNGPPNTSEITMNMPRTGTSSAELYLENANGFAGFFQDVSGVVPGSPIDWGVWAKETTSENGQGIEMRIEYRDSVQDIEISRTANLTPLSLGSAYEKITLSDVIPAGADTARVVFAIQSFGAGVPQTVFVDDAMVMTQIVPEPTTLALMGLGGIAIVSMRRRK